MILASLIIVHHLLKLFKVNVNVTIRIGAAEGSELSEVDETVVVGVKVFHDTLKLVLRDGGSEGAEDVFLLGDEDEC